VDQSIYTISNFLVPLKSVIGRLLLLTCGRYMMMGHGKRRRTTCNVYLPHQPSLFQFSDIWLLPSHTQLMESA